MSKAKILIDKTPDGFDECPFGLLKSMSYRCRVDDCECHCLLYFHDSQIFYFDKCPYCKVFKQEQDYE